MAILLRKSTLRQPSLSSKTNLVCLCASQTDCATAADALSLCSWTRPDFDNIHHLLLATAHPISDSSIYPSFVVGYHLSYGPKTASTDNSFLPLVSLYITHFCIVVLSAFLLIYRAHTCFLNIYFYQTLHILGTANRYALDVKGSKLRRKIYSFCSPLREDSQKVVGSFDQLHHFYCFCEIFSRVPLRSI